MPMGGPREGNGAFVQGGMSSVMSGLRFGGRDREAIMDSGEKSLRTKGYYLDGNFSATIQVDESTRW